MRIDNQLACIYSNIDTLAAGCCKNRILQIVSDTRIISRECEIDVNTYCQNCDYGPCFGLSFAVGMYNQSSQCAKDIISKAQIGALSPKCLLAFLYCPLDSVWPITFGNTTANETCGAGYSGYQTRLCDNSLGYADWSSVIDRSECHILRCPSEIGPYGQLWPETTVNYIATAQGGYDKLNNFSQVGEGLQSESINGECSFLLGSTYYARRKCQISPFFGTAEWLNPIVECRPAIAFTWPIKFEKTICDMITEEMTQGQLSGGNLIGVVPWGMIIPFPPGVPEFMQEDIILGYSQQYCEQALTNCVAFSYNSVTKFAFYFDYCGEILTASDLHNGTIPEYFPGYYSIAMYPLGVPTYVPPGYLPWGDIPGNLDTFADYMTTYIAPLSKEQFTGEYCSAMSSFDSNQEFIPASAAWNHNGIPNPYCFYNTLWLYYIDPLGGVLHQGNIEFSVPYADLNISNTGIISTKNSFSIRNMDSDQDAVDTILSLREKLLEWKTDEFYVIPGGFVVKFFSQYIGVQDYMLTNLIMVTFAVIGVGFVFLLNPIAVIVCVACNIMMIIEVYGFAHYVGLRINGVLVLNIVVAIGLTMEFTAHIGRAFVLTNHSGTISLSEGQDRMKQTLKEMFVPVTLGAVTTIIGIAPISAANFPYFKLYYFNLYVIIVLFGWLNGVIFQPIILSLYPPKSFELPADSSNVNSSSTPQQQQQQQQAHNTQASVELGNL